MKLSIGAVAVIAVLATPLVSAAQEAEVTANVGWVSDYYYRGLPQNGSSASAGVDVAAGALYVGAWAADVGDGEGSGNEVDLYAGLGAEVEDFSVSVGGTGYFYTGYFDDTYLELNTNAGYGILSAEFSYGRWKPDTGDEDYWFLGITVEEAGAYATLGSFGKYFNGEYFEAGYAFSTADLDLSVAWIYTSKTLLGATPADNDHTLVFGISKTFALN